MMGFGSCWSRSCASSCAPNRLLAVAAVFVLFGIVGPLTDRYMKELFDAIGTEGGGFTVPVVPPPSLEGAATQILKNLSQFGIICALLLAMGSVAWEKERGTAGMILTKPASRAAFLAAKLVAISADPRLRGGPRLRLRLRLRRSSSTRASSRWAATWP